MLVDENTEIRKMYYNEKKDYFLMGFKRELIAKAGFLPDEYVRVLYEKDTIIIKRDKDSIMKDIK